MEIPIIVALIGAFASIFSVWLNHRLARGPKVSPSSGSLAVNGSNKKTTLSLLFAILGLLGLVGTHTFLDGSPLLLANAEDTLCLFLSLTAILFGHAARRRDHGAGTSLVALLIAYPTLGMLILELVYSAFAPVVHVALN